jgi:hypothetical protein
MLGLSATSWRSTVRYTSELLDDDLSRRIHSICISPLPTSPTCKWPYALTVYAICDLLYSYTWYIYGHVLYGTPAFIQQFPTIRTAPCLYLYLFIYCIPIIQAPAPMLYAVSVQAVLYRTCIRYPYYTHTVQYNGALEYGSIKIRIREPLSSAL